MAKELVLSKSRINLYLQCPRAYEFRHIKKIVEQDVNPYFEIGKDVHSFLDEFFDITKITGHNITNLTGLNFSQNTEYKKNAAKFMLERWDILKDMDGAEQLFRPHLRETNMNITIEDVKVTGFVDAVYKLHTKDKLAPINPEFKDGDFSIIEYKTGVPNHKKAKGYEEDIMYYKIMLEQTNPELGNMSWGSIYFPYNNYVHTFKINEAETNMLKKKIVDVNKDIINSTVNNLWPHKPSAINCQYCQYKSICKHKYTK